MTQLVMKQYVLLRGSLEQLSNDVNYYITTGWIPHGPPQVDASGYTLIQAMVRFEEQSPPAPSIPPESYWSGATVS